MSADDLEAYRVKTTDADKELAQYKRQAPSSPDAQMHDTGDDPLEDPTEPTAADARYKGLLRGVPFLGGALPQVNALVDAFGHRDDQSFGDAYRNSRDYNVKQDDDLRKKFPGDFLKGELVSGIATPIPGMSKVMAMGKGAKYAALAGMGGLEALSRSKADLTKGEVGEAAKDVGIGGVLGAAGGAAGDALGWAGKKLASVDLPALGGKAKDAAEWLAISALRPYKKYTNQLVNKELTKPLGRDLLDSGAVSFLDNNNSAMKKLVPQSVQRNQKLNELFDYLTSKQTEKAGPYANIVDIGDSVLKKAADVDTKKITDPARQALLKADSETMQPERLGVMQSEADKLLKLQPNPGTEYGVDLNRLRNIRQKVGANINFNRGNGKGGTADAEQDIYGLLTNATKKSADDIAAAHAPDLVGAVPKADNQSYLNSLALEIGGNRQAADMANRIASVTDNYAAGTGMLMGGHDSSGLENTLHGLGMGLLNNQVRTRGASAGAVALDKIGNALGSDTAKTMSKAGNVVGKYLPQVGGPGPSRFVDFMNGDTSNTDQEPPAPTKEVSSTNFVENNRPKPKQTNGAR